MTPDNETTLQQRFGERLKRARRIRGLSLRGLSDAIDGRVTYAALQKYEKGLMGPSGSVMLALANALGVDADYLLRPNIVQLAGIEFRKRSKCGKTEVDRIREEAHDFFERYLEIESILEIEPKPDFEPFDLTQVSEEDLPDAVEQAAATLRKRWRLGHNPIQNLHEELEHAGVKVREVDSTGEFDGFSGWAESPNARLPIIVLAKHLNSNLPRKRFTAAHELGHLVLKFPEGLSKKTQENLCNRFAAAFMMPPSALSEFGEERSKILLGELKALKAEWGLSLQTLMRRFEDLGIISPSRRKSFDFRYRNHFKWHEKGEPGEWNGSEDSTRFAQLVYRAAAEELITRAKAASLLNVAQAEFDTAAAVVG